MYLPNIGVEVHETPLNQTVIEQTPRHNVKPKKRTLKTRFDQPKLDQPKITTLTYNLWLENSYSKERVTRVIHIIRDTMPDVVCLQEISQDVFKFIESMLAPFFQIFQAFVTEDNPYGTCIMCNRKTVRIIESEDNPYYYDYNSSKMSRRIVGCEIEFIKFAAPKFHVLTTHLESLSENDRYRASQFNAIKQAVASLKYCIVMGDFGIWNENEDAAQAISNSKLKDAWIEMGCPYKVKYTYNSRKNPNAKEKGQYRFDRILYHTRDHLIKPKTMGLLGKNNISTELPFPASNHYGLYCEFEVKESD